MVGQVIAAPAKDQEQKVSNQASVRAFKRGIALPTNFRLDCFNHLSVNRHTGQIPR